jgi:hypothetical protein
MQLIFSPMIKRSIENGRAVSVSPPVSPGRDEA